MTLDEATLQLRPPEFLIKNDFLLRFHDTTTDHHLLIDGNPRGPSALNFIKAMQRKKMWVGNIEWLDATSTTSCALSYHPHHHDYTNDGGGGNHNHHDRHHHPVPMALVPLSKQEYHTMAMKHVTLALGMGHMVNDLQWSGSSTTTTTTTTTTTNTTTPNVEFHLYQLPHELPSYYYRYVPNVCFSDHMEGRNYTVLVCAAERIEVVEGGRPVELLAQYSHSRHKLGFPLL